MSFVIPSITSVEVTAATEKFAWKTHQILGDFNPPTLNTLHSIISSTQGMKVLAVEVRQTNTGTDAEEIDVVIEQDGNTWIYDSSDIGQMTNNKKYGIRALPANVDEAVYKLDAVDIDARPIPLFIGGGSESDGEPLEGHDVNVQVRQTSPIEIGARIMCKVTYQLLEAV